MSADGIPQTTGRMTRAMRAKLEASGLTPSAASTAPRPSAVKGTPAAGTPLQSRSLFQDVTNMTAQKQQPEVSSKKAQPTPSKEEAQKSPVPLKAEGSESDVAAFSVKTERGRSSELQAAEAEQEMAGQQPAEPEASAAQHLSEHLDQNDAGSDAAHPDQGNMQEVVQQEATPARAPVLPPFVAHTASKVEQAQHAGASKTPLTAVKVDAATPALRKPEVAPAPSASTTLTVSQPASGDEDAQAEDGNATAPHAQEAGNSTEAGSELFGEVHDEQGQPIGAVEYAGSDFNRGLEQDNDMASPQPLTMSPVSPAVWSFHEATPATGPAATPSPTVWSLAGATPAADGGDYTAMPTPAEYTMHAGATPAAGKSTAAPSPAVWSMADTTPAAGTPAVAPSPSVWSAAGVATPQAIDQDMADQVPGSQLSARTCAMGATGLRIGGGSFVAGHRREGEEEEEEGSEEGVEEQVPASALDSLVSAEVMLANAQARMAAMQQEAAAAAPKAAKPRLKSVVVASEAYDPRSLSQIRRELKEASLKKKAEAAQEAQAQAAQVQNLTDVRLTPLVSKAAYKGEEEEGEEEVEDSEAWEEGEETALGEQLAAAMGGLGIRPAGAKPEALWGVPLPQGSHIRFDDDGQAVDSPTSGKPVLKGLPVATGTHIRFD